MESSQVPSRTVATSVPRGDVIVVKLQKPRNMTANHARPADDQNFHVFSSRRYGIVQAFTESLASPSMITHLSALEFDVQFIQTPHLRALDVRKIIICGQPNILHPVEHPLEGHRCFNT